MLMSKLTLWLLVMVAPLTIQQNEIEQYGVYTGQEIVGEITHYCSCVKCCGKSDGITASGVLVQDGMVACNWLPFNSKVLVNGQSFIVTDRGGKSLNEIGRLDIYVGDGHQVALEKGRVKEVSITILELP